SDSRTARGTRSVHYCARSSIFGKAEAGIEFFFLVAGMQDKRKPRVTEVRSKGYVELKSTRCECRTPGKKLRRQTARSVVSRRAQTFDCPDVSNESRLHPAIHLAALLSLDRSRCAERSRRGLPPASLLPTRNCWAGSGFLRRPSRSACAVRGHSALLSIPTYATGSGCHW